MDFTQDYKYWIGARSMVHTHKTETGDTPTTIATALKQQIRVQDEGGNWILSARTCTIFLPGALVATDPKEGDTITDGADVWTITPGGAAKEELTNVWECNCVKER